VFDCGVPDAYKHGTDAAISGNARLSAFLFQQHLTRELQS
jgi:hypothetical protein